MVLDEKVYAEPTKFNPDRFLPKSQGGNGEPHLGAVFGFGRRRATSQLDGHTFR